MALWVCFSALLDTRLLLFPGARGSGPWVIGSTVQSCGGGSRLGQIGAVCYLLFLLAVGFCFIFHYFINHILFPVSLER